MQKEKESTTKFKIDISELKAGMQEAKRQIRLANAEFKSATAGMDNWSRSADGVSAKIKQLNTTLDAEKKQLDLLKQQYALVTKEQGENSKGAEELKIKILNQEAAVSKTKKSLQDYETALSDLKQDSQDTAKGIDEVTESAKEADEAAETAANGGFTILKGTIANLTAEVIKEAVKGLKEIVTMSDEVNTRFQQSTGKSAKEVKEFKREIDNLYQNGYGKSLLDVSDTMAEISQSTKETDPGKIAQLTKNALNLRDVFGYDITETMRAVNMLIDQFGVTGDEAFNLIIQGAQNGLDKNGDLLDTINEYAVHYKQQGYSAEEFFNSLKNGAETGTFSIDKLGDAMKEFGIRTKDTSTTTVDAFTLLGYSAEKSTGKIEGTKGSVAELQAKFAEGGESAREAANEVLESLYSMDDKVKQNQVGVDLFGTMWEDLGIDGVKALSNVNGDMDKTKSSMQEINDLTENSLDTQIKELGRTIQTELFVPVVEDMLPEIKKGIKWTIENSETLKGIIVILGGTIATAFVVKKVVDFASGVKKLIEITKSLKKAQDALNLSQSASVWGAVALAIGGVITVTGFLIDTYQDLQNSDRFLTDESKILKDELYEQKTAWEELKSERDKSVEETNNEFTYYQDLKDELDQIVDKNGEIKQGYEDRAEVIVNTLNQHLGTEVQLTGNTLQNYKDISKELDNIIQKKKAEALLEVYDESYHDALKSSGTLRNTYLEAQTSESEKKSILDSAQKKYDEAKKELEKYQKENPEGRDTTRRIILADASKELQSAKAEYSLAVKYRKEYETEYLESINTMNNYQKLQTAVQNGNQQQIETAMTNLSNNLVTADNATSYMLGKQVIHYKELFDNAKEAVKKGTPGVTQEMVDQYGDLYKTSNEELKKFVENSGEKGSESALGLIDSLGTKKYAWYIANQDFAEAGIEGFLSTMDTADPGKQYAQGLINALAEQEGPFQDAAKELASSGTFAIKKEWDEHSPSRVSHKLADFFVLSLLNRFKEGKKELAQQSQEMAGAITAEFKDLHKADFLNKAIHVDFGDVSAAKNILHNTTDNFSPKNNVINNTNNVTNNYFEQHNTSPKALSALEIYRQTNTLFKAVTRK